MIPPKKTVREILKELIESPNLLHRFAFRSALFFTIVSVVLYLEEYLVNVVAPKPKKITIGSLKRMINIYPSEYTEKWNDYEESMVKYIMPELGCIYLFNNYDKGCLVDFSIFLTHCTNHDKKMMSKRIYSIPYFKEKIILLYDKDVNINSKNNVFFVLEEKSLKDFVRRQYEADSCFLVETVNPFSYYEIKTTHRCIFICTESVFHRIEKTIPMNYNRIVTENEISYHFAIKEEYDALLPTFDELLLKFLEENPKYEL